MTVKLGNFWNCLLRRAECRRQAWLTACLIWKNIGRTDGSKFFGIFALYFEYLREKRIVVNLVTENFVDFLFMLERLFISLININNSHRYKLELIFIKNVFIMKYVAKVIFDVVVPHPGWNGMQNSTLDEFLIIGIILLPFLNTYFLFHTSNFTASPYVDLFAVCTELLISVSAEDESFFTSRFTKTLDLRWDCKWFYYSSTNFRVTVITFLAVLNLIFYVCVR